MKIIIISERWSIPDYRRGETEKDSKPMRLEIESNLLRTTRYAENMDDEQVITRLKLIQTVIEESIKQEKRRLKNANKKSL